MKNKVDRNDPCPCGSGRKYKKCCMPKRPSESTLTWIDEDGMHFVGPGSEMSADQLNKMTEEYQRQIRNSPLWDKMVREFGREKAEDLLKQCRAKLG